MERTGQQSGFLKIILSNTPVLLENFQYVNRTSTKLSFCEMILIQLVHYRLLSHSKDDSLFEVAIICHRVLKWDMSRQFFYYRCLSSHLLLHYVRKTLTIFTCMPAKVFNYIPGLSLKMTLNLYPHPKKSSLIRQCSRYTEF